MGLGFPVACFMLIYGLLGSRNWATSLMERYPVLFIAALATAIGPLVIVGWWEYSRRKSERARR
jgi:hypothetical protein